MVEVGINPQEGGWFGKFFCSKPHPENPGVYCRRLPHAEDEPHRAFVFSIVVPEEWFDE